MATDYTLWADENKCYSCAQTVETLYPTYWTPFKVCSSCVLHSDEFPEHMDMPTPPEVLEAILQSPTVEAVQQAFRLSQRKGVQSDRPVDPARKEIA